MYLPDINVWIALAFEAHSHHAIAKAWFDGLVDEPCYFCRLTQQGFLRLATNHRAVGAAAVTMDGAWQLYDAFSGERCVEFAVEPPGLEAHWRDLTSKQTLSPKIWNDAYLAAFAMSANCELVSCDRGFRQFDKLKATILV